MGISKIKVCCLIIFLLATIQDVAAQINFGIKAGYLRSKTATEIIDKWHNGFCAGAVLSYDISKEFALRCDLFYSTRGYEENDGIVDKNGVIRDVKANFGYINLPILVEYNVLPFAAIQAGPQFGLQTNRTLYYDDVKQNDALFGEKQIFDFSLVAGIKLKYKNLFAELQYQHGLTSAYRHVDIFKTKAISVNLGYMFNLKK